jgi:diguanylate cyclase (GGDEF)-like protein
MEGTLDAPPSRASESSDRKILLSFMEIASATAVADDLDTVLETITRSLRRLFPVDGAALGLLEGEGILVREVLKRGTPSPREPERLPADASHLMGWVIQRDRALWRNDILSEMRFAESVRTAGMKSDMTIPLKARGQVMGAFRVASHRRHAFDPEDFEVLKRCADMTAVAVETQRLLLATRRLAEMDGVTGVYNHRHFRSLLDQEVDRARRSERPVSLIMIDIDYFKRFNDTYGHQAGDEVLRHVAQLAARALRRSDAVARYGGEEFVVLLPDAESKDALPVAEKIRSEVEKNPLTLGGMLRPLHVTISLGIASFPADAINPPELVAVADRGLYQAKNLGRNRTCHAPSGLRND